MLVRAGTVVFLVALVGCMALVRRRGEFVVAEGGRPRCCIRVAQGDERRAALAKELQRWLKRVTGAEIPLSDEGRRAIVLGLAAEHPRAAKKARLDELGPEGFAVESRSDRLLLLANTELGLQHAVYAFLEEIGCRWFFPDPVWTVVPKRPTLVVECRLREKPAFAFRRIWYGWGPRTEKLRRDYNAWLVHNRQLGHFRTDCGHAYDRYVPRRLFERHPEWFALVKGKRQPTQLCTSNPEVQKRVIEGVLAVFRKDPGRVMASVEPNDGGGYCECERCKALGSVSDRVFHLAGVVAKALRKEFPDKWVGLYAYAFHADPPSRPLPPGVYVQVTTGFRYTKLSFDQQVAAFRKLGATVGVYDYFSVYAWDWDLPGKAKAGRVYELAKAIRHYRELGLSTYDAESACNWGPNGLGYWMAAKLMWNPDLEPEALVEDFCTRAFGRAAPHVRRIYERWATGKPLTAARLRAAILDLAQAYEAEKDGAVVARLDRLAMYLHCLRLWLDYQRAAKAWPKAASADQVIAAAKELIVFYRRLMDTGLVHTYPALHTDRFRHRFKRLLAVKGLDLEEVERWKKARTDIPTVQESRRVFADDLAWARGR